MTPSAHGSGVAYLLDLAQGQEEGVVYGILGLPAMPEYPKGQAVERCSVTFEQEPQAGGVPTLGCPNKFRIVHHLRLSFWRPHYEHHTKRTHRVGKKFDVGKKIVVAIRLREVVAAEVLRQNRLPPIGFGGSSQ